MKQHIAKRFVSCLLILCMLTLYTTACSSDAEKDLPSLEDAQKVQAGMSYFEAVEILGIHAQRPETGVYYVQWMLDNGQALVAILQTRNHDAPILSSVKITNDSFGAAGEDLHLKNMKVFHTIWEYNEYASGEDILYEGISSENYVYASALQCLGAFERYYYAPANGGLRHYTYIFTDENGIQVEVDVYQDQKTIPNLGENIRVLDSVPKDTADMRKLVVDSPVAYYDRNGLLYCYSQNGELHSIKWIDDNVCFSLSGSLSSYPMNGADTLVKRMLSASDPVAEDAWNDLKNYIYENNNKPVSVMQTLIGMAAAFLVVGVGVTSLMIIRRKRAKKAATQQVPAEQESSPGE